MEWKHTLGNIIKSMLTKTGTVKDPQRVKMKTDKGRQRLMLRQTVHHLQALSFPLI